LKKAPQIPMSNISSFNTATPNSNEQKHIALDNSDERALPVGKVVEGNDYGEHSGDATPHLRELSHVTSFATDNDYDSHAKSQFANRRFSDTPKVGSTHKERDANGDMGVLSNTSDRTSVSRAAKNQHTANSGAILYGSKSNLKASSRRQNDTKHSHQRFVPNQPKRVQ
jgi:hypothetical protein